ncbi:TPA: hypothetical protein ACUN3Z_002255 [Salmonella enterica subsp. enterica serovar Enteritidis]
MFCRDADLFTQQKSASPRDGLITPSTRKAVTAGALFCFVEKPTGGGNRHLEGLTMNDDRMTVVPDFLGELDAGVFMNKIAAALNTVGLGVLNNGNKGKGKIRVNCSVLKALLTESLKRLSEPQLTKSLPPL